MSQADSVFIAAVLVAVVWMGEPWARSLAARWFAQRDLRWPDRGRWFMGPCVLAMSSAIRSGDAAQRSRAESIPEARTGLFPVSKACFR